MTTIVKVGERGVDFSFSKPPSQRLIELGYTFVVGYISVPPASQSKNLTKAQCEGYLAAGLKVLLVWEMSATSPNQGAAVGASHGRDAKRLAADRGCPTDVPILAAVDTNTVSTNIAAHEAYVRAFAQACAPYPIGIYGDTDILARTAELWRIGWVPNAWSWSGTSRSNADAKARALGAHVLQRTGFHIDDRYAVDPNETIADFPAWGLATPTDGDDMLQEVLVPQFTAAKPWFPYLACFDSGVVRPSGPSKMVPVLGQTHVTDEGQYRRMCAAAGIQLETEFPPCLDGANIVVDVEASDQRGMAGTVDLNAQTIDLNPK